MQMSKCISLQIMYYGKSVLTLVLCKELSKNKSVFVDNLLP